MHKVTPNVNDFTLPRGGVVCGTEGRSCRTIYTTFIHIHVLVLRTPDDFVSPDWNVWIQGSFLCRTHIVISISSTHIHISTSQKGILWKLNVDILIIIFLHSLPPPPPPGPTEYLFSFKKFLHFCFRYSCLTWRLSTVLGHNHQETHPQHSGWSATCLILTMLASPTLSMVQRSISSVPTVKWVPLGGTTLTTGLNTL